VTLDHLREIALISLSQAQRSTGMIDRYATRNETFPDGRRVRLLFAGGTKGRRVRADGKGELLARGWYYRHDGQSLNGPFPTITQARNVALQLQ
jgi:hypothetical protein